MTALPQVAAEDPSARVVAPGRLGYRPGLDGIRALAVLAVMVHHAPRQVLLGGQMGVQVFFVLSGFLITVLLLEERAKTGRVSLRAFYVRRALRLLPAAYTVILVGIVLVAVGATTAYGLSSTLGEAFAGTGMTGTEPSSLAATRRWGICGRLVSRSSSTCCGLLC